MVLLQIEVNLLLIVADNSSANFMSSDTEWLFGRTIVHILYLLILQYAIDMRHYIIP